MRVGLVVGEASGDLLGAGLMAALRQRWPEARFEGIAGPQMEAAGCRAIHPAERLSVMGFTEVLRHLPGLLRIRSDLKRRFLDEPPDVFVGIDAPDFNLALERQLRRAGIPTVHYVSPSVWAWRRRRVKRIAGSVDLMLTLFPFEADFYREQGVAVRFVGHPLADMIPDRPDRTAARQALGLPEAKRIVALLPGSRRSEVERLAGPFLETARWCLQRRDDLHFVVPLVSAPTRALFTAALERLGGGLPVTLVDGESRQAMAASDSVLLASGTATLEALLLKRPMVVAYRLAPLTHWLAKRMLKVPYYSLPNNLAGEPLVPEFTQDEVTAERLGPALLATLDDPDLIRRLETRFQRIHEQLRRDASASAAEAIAALVGRQGTGNG